MFRYNYRIVKKLINYYHMSILRKILAQSCHMATSGRKELSATWVCIVIYFFFIEPVSQPDFCYETCQDIFWKDIASCFFLFTILIKTWINWRKIQASKRYCIICSAFNIKWWIFNFSVIHRILQISDSMKTLEAKYFFHRKVHLLVDLWYI